MSGFLSLDDLETLAAEKLPGGVFDYFRGGAGEEATLTRNFEAFKEVFIRPRILRDVSSRDLSTVVLNGNAKMALPIGIAPIASQKLSHVDGEIAIAKAAARNGTIMIVSTMSTTPLEDVALAHRNPHMLWYQLYVFKDRARTESLVRRAAAAGYGALVVTVDVPVAGKRRKDIKNRFSFQQTSGKDCAQTKDATVLSTGPPTSGVANYINTMFDASLSWKDIDWLRTISDLPIILKGIMTEEDALIAVEHKVSGIIVSNHGGRQLDFSMATLDVLPEIANAVNGRCDVYLDGGIRSGTDVFKALALGAKAVFVGRPIIWGLACKGEEGVSNVLEMLRDELDNTMALAGCTTVSQLNQEFVRRCKRN